METSEIMQGGLIISTEFVSNQGFSRIPLVTSYIGNWHLFFLALGDLVLANFPVETHEEKKWYLIEANPS